MIIEILLVIVVVLLFILIFLILRILRSKKVEPEDIESAVSGTWIKLGLDKKIGAVESHAKDIIRSWYKLEDYVKYHETRIGGRYGRRLIRLAARAKNYHDIHPQHRQTKIKIYQGPKKEEVVIYETKKEKGLGGVKQRVNWGIRRFFSIY